MCDLLAPIVCLYPELITNKEDFPVSVELNGQYTRSMMIVRVSCIEIIKPDFEIYTHFEVDRMVGRWATVLPNKSTACLVVEIDIEKASKLKEMKFY